MALSTRHKGAVHAFGRPHMNGQGEWLFKQIKYNYRGTAKRAAQDSACSHNADDQAPADRTVRRHSPRLKLRLSTSQDLPALIHAGFSSTTT